MNLDQQCLSSVIREICIADSPGKEQSAVVAHTVCLWAEKDVILLATSVASVFHHFISSIYCKQRP